MDEIKIDAAAIDQFNQLGYEISKAARAVLKRRNDICIEITGESHTRDIGHYVFNGVDNEDVGFRNIYDSDYELYIPTSWLFDDEWEKQYREETTKHFMFKKAQADKRAAELAAKKEADEMEVYMRLKAKFEIGDNG